MKTLSHSIYWLSVGILLSFGLVNCGSDGQQAGSVSAPPAAPPAAPTDLAQDLGGYRLSCPNQQGGQQSAKQVPFQKSEQSNCNKQEDFRFKQSKVSDFNLKLDCDQRWVTVDNQGPDRKQKAFPIQADGSVRGEMQYLQQVAGDGLGNVDCWVEYRVQFDGRANCKSNGRRFNAVNGGETPSPSSTPSTSGEDSLEITTAVFFQETSLSEIQDAGITEASITDRNPVSPSPEVSPSPFPSESETPIRETPTSEPTPEETEMPGTVATSNPSVSPSPSPSASVSPSPSSSVSVSPSPTVTVSPRPSPTTSPGTSPSPTISPRPRPTPPAPPIITPIKVCRVVNPCPQKSKTELSCGSRQSSSSDWGRY